ncbi:pumilio homolog 3-like isoform X2 [Ptychodera flava]|uniref:pumilio homolog 3-like isoform X2 n=1 Tax=Ptychodera flava TaxID=63121 RepID=UPI00396A8F98
MYNSVMGEKGKVKKQKRRMEEGDDFVLTTKKAKKTKEVVKKPKRGKVEGKESKKVKSKNGLEKKKQGYPKIKKKQKKEFKSSKTTDKKKKSKKDSENKDDDKTSKLFEMTKKGRKDVRRQTKNNYELSKRAKTIWETVRRHNCSEETRRKVMAELYSLVKGKAKELVFAHDTVRVLQCCIQYGSAEQRSNLFEELKDDLIDISKNKYSKFCALKMLRYGTRDQKDHIIKSFYGKVAKLIKHKEASEVLESAYNNYANAKQRASLLEEFYGAEYSLFKTEKYLSLTDLIQEHPEKKELILKHMKGVIASLLEKSVVKHSIVHKTLFDYYTNADLKSKIEIIESMREVVVQILHTHEGSRVAMQSIWFGTAKDRKAIIKSFKTFVVKICQEEYGNLVLAAIFDAVDDTKLVSKVILNEILAELKAIAMNAHGRKVLLYLLSGRDPSYCHPDVVKILQQGDGNPTSKKESDVRHKELVQYVSPKLLQLVVDETKTLVYDKSYSQLVLAVIQHAQGDKRPAMVAIATLAAEEFIPQVQDSSESLDQMHIAEHPAGHLMLKRLIQQDKDRTESEELFSKVLLETIDKQQLVLWAKINRSAFVVCSLLENGKEDTRRQAVEILTPAKKALSKVNTKGTQLLLSKLESS